MKAAYVAQATHLLNDVRTAELVDTPLTRGAGDTSPEQAKRPASRRGTTNGNARGGADDRRRRRDWLVETYQADVDVVELDFPLPYALHTDLGLGIPACRCYRCGTLLTGQTVTVDRIVPGCQGGTYRRSNIRPACGPCNSETGGRTRGKRS